MFLNGIASIIWLPQIKMKWQLFQITIILVEVAVNIAAVAAVAVVVVVVVVVTLLYFHLNKTYKSFIRRSQTQENSTSIITFTIGIWKDIWMNTIIFP